MQPDGDVADTESNNASNATDAGNATNATNSTSNKTDSEFYYPFEAYNYTDSRAYSR